MRAVNYTLMIVESPTIKKAIEVLDISGLEVIATSGYAWMPVADPKTGKLKARANPDSASFRKDLQDRALLASRIIIATDSDPSGQFLAQAITAYLKRDDRISFGMLTSIDRESMERMINKSYHKTSLTADNLARYFTARTLLQRYIAHQTGSPVSLPAMLSAGMLLGKTRTRDFIGSNNRHYQSDKPIEVNLGDSFEAIKTTNTSAEYWKPNALPPSTAILPWNPESGFEQIQNMLNRMFSTWIDELDSTLISYPRTELRGYYPQTWSRLQSEYTSINGAENLKPDSMLSQVTPQNGHEALHVTRFSHTPDEMRAWLKKEELALYTLIYEATVASITQPEKVKPDTVLTTSSGTFIPADKSGDPSENTSLRPFLPVETFSQQLFSTGWVKPSSLGKTLDGLIEEGWIEIQSDPVPHVTAGPAAEKLEEATRSVALRLNRCAEQLHEIAMEYQEIDASWRRIFTDCLQNS